MINKRYKYKSLPLILLQLSLLMSRCMVAQLRLPFSDQLLGILCEKWQRKQHMWYGLQRQRQLLSSPLSMVSLKISETLRELQPIWAIKETPSKSLKEDFSEVTVWLFPKPGCMIGAVKFHIATVLWLCSSQSNRGSHNLTEVQNSLSLSWYQEFTGTVRAQRQVKSVPDPWLWSYGCNDYRLQAEFHSNLTQRNIFQVRLQ